MTKVLAIGFNKQDVTPVEGLILAVHTPGRIEGMSPSEYILKCVQTAKEADVVILKANNRPLTEDEVILFYSAYTNSSPIFLLEEEYYDYYEDNLLSGLVTNYFNEYGELIEHLKVHYTKTIL